MATIVDARGKACPQPVIETKNAIREQGTPVITMVDNDIARQNVAKMARQLGPAAESRPTSSRRPAARPSRRPRPARPSSCCPRPIWAQATTRWARRS